MARYEELGYCPKNALGSIMKLDLAEVWGDIPYISVYDLTAPLHLPEYGIGKCFIEALVEKDRELSFAVGAAINSYFNAAGIDVNDKKESKVSFVDVVSAEMIPGIKVAYTSYEGIKFTSNPDKKLTVLSDSKFVVGIKPGVNPETCVVYILPMKK